MSDFLREDLVPPLMIGVVNSGRRLVSTTYWETEQAAHGFMYLTTNAGCVRLLVPQPAAHPARMSDMTKGVREIVLTRGRFEGHDNCVEVLFEDYSASPFSIQIDAKQVDRHWLPRDEAKLWRFAIYTELGLFAEFGRCWLRRRPRLPYALRWSGP
jgi:hypothetical protein